MQSDVQKFSKQEKQKIKTQQKSCKQIICETCNKTYPKQSDLEQHTKLKHIKTQRDKQVPKQKPSKPQPRNRVLQMQQNDHQDLIYSYLGELGEKNQENTTRQDLLLLDENQRQNIQTNYSFNKVVRTPYQKQLIATNIIPNQWVQKSPHADFIKNLVLEMTLLYHALELEKDKWEFRDPMAPEEEAEDQFSLMEIRKLILNYPRRKLTLKYPHFSIYLLWVGRICKPMAWDHYLAEYYDSGLTGKAIQKWQKFNSEFQSGPIKGYVVEKLSICDEKTVKKLVQFFNKWTVLFGLVNDFC